VDENRDYAQVLIEDDGTTQVSYTYGDDLISQDRGGEAYFYHYDGLGSTRSLTDSLGNLANTYDYEAFGEVLGQTGSVENSYLFAGEQFDNTLDQYYLRARYYDQSAGRFASMDSWQGDTRSPITLNKYVYADANPANKIDPSGHMSAIGQVGAVSTIGILASMPMYSFQVARVDAIGGTWGDGLDIGPRSTGWLILAAMVGTNSSLLSNMVEKINEDDTSAYTLYHGTDIATARLLAGGTPIEIDSTRCNWGASCGGFYLADQLGDAEHFAVFTQSGPRDGGVVQYSFTASAYLTIKGIATIRPILNAPRFNPLGNEIVVPPSGFSVFNSLMLKGDITPGPVR
ncbi:MAG: RHS repeat-associated core domain-containing protein, partial [Candidatus Thiodiazotropha taylori]|nr:RHS repeat-associated core domain-containing protein [Candidatus Thiodiazotropha taylori]MCW4259011.1 RHS repeat-associated core domain-containing protein [Candidatus Thiodiazotropha taylori]